MKEMIVVRIKGKQIRDIDAIIYDLLIEYLTKDGKELEHSVEVIEL